MPTRTLNEPTKRRSILRHEILLISNRNQLGLSPRQFILREMEVHFVTVEVGVVRVAVGVVHADRFVIAKDVRLVGLCVVRGRGKGDREERKEREITMMDDL